MNTFELETMFLLTRIRKTMCLLSNHPDHPEKTAAVGRVVKDIDHLVETHGPTADELLHSMSGLNHFDGKTQTSEKGDTT